MRIVNADSSYLDERTVLQTISLATLGQQWTPHLRFLVPVDQLEEVNQLDKLVQSGLTNLVLLSDVRDITDGYPHAAIWAEKGAIEIGDVIATLPSQQQVHILFRTTDLHHTVFLTNRCNSHCLMCSQPPTRQIDDWLVEEAKQIALHLPCSPEIIGFTGGEPLLLGTQLCEVIDFFATVHPATRFEVLTNGRLFSDERLAEMLCATISAQVTWMIPLYGHTDFLHDFVVQVPGAFEQTLNGLLTLQAYRQPIQLRIVLIQPVLEILPDLCDYIGRNLPFVQEVALMGCEPIGFALANASLCQVDVSDWGDQLAEAVRRLSRYKIPSLLMNLPHCAIPHTLWPIAHRSISDWKQTYTTECIECDYRSDCAGMFVWNDKVGWIPTPIRENIGSD